MKKKKFRPKSSEGPFSLPLAHITYKKTLFQVDINKPQHTDNTGSTCTFAVYCTPESSGSAQAF